MGVWSCLKACLGRTAAAPARVTDAVPVAPAVTVSVEESEAPERDFAAFFRVVEVVDADFLVGALFRRRFSTDSFPGSPKHFVAFYKGTDGTLLPLGYVHFEIWEGQAMGGGLVIDERAYRRAARLDREVIRAKGGVAEAMLRESFALLPSNVMAIWAYIGDPLSEKVNRRVGFLPTGEQYLRVIWRSELDVDAKAYWLKRVVEYGPF